jgi:hypothetical protein
LSCAVEGDAELRLCLCKDCGVPRYSGEDRCGCTGSKREMQQNCRGRRHTGALLANHADARLRPILGLIGGHRAVMAAVPSATRRQSPLRCLQPEQGGGQWQSEDQHQRNGE